MKRLMTLIVMCLVILSCRQDHDGDAIDISSVGSTTTVDKAAEYNLTVSGLNNNVTIADNNKINRFVLSGLNNLITVGVNTTIKEFIVSGSDNTVYVPAGSGITFDENSGFGNQLIEQ